ncbi:MAG: RDD family protein [Verrucomicrobiota bacterium]
MNYHVARNGQQLGVLSSTDISLKLSSGELSPEDLAWAEGMASWQPINSIAELASGSSFATPPPPMEVNPYAVPRAQIMSSPRTGSATAGSGELASLGQRLGAYFLEIVAALPGAIPFFMAGMTVDKETQQMTPMGGILMAIGGLYLVGLIIYNLVRLSSHGQSIGKKWMGIRIVNYEDGSNPGFVKAVMVRGFVNGLIGAVPFLGIFYAIADIFFIFREDRRCIHDLLAGTHVVKC